MRRAAKPRSLSRDAPASRQAPGCTPRVRPRFGLVVVEVLGLLLDLAFIVVPRESTGAARSAAPPGRLREEAHQVAARDVVEVLADVVPVRRSSSASCSGVGARSAHRGERVARASRWRELARRGARAPQRRTGDARSTEDRAAIRKRTASALDAATAQPAPKCLARRSPATEACPRTAGAGARARRRGPQWTPEERPRAACQALEDRAKRAPYDRAGLIEPSVLLKVAYSRPGGGRGAPRPRRGRASRQAPGPIRSEYRKRP